MSPHLVQSVAKVQMDDSLRSAERRRFAADARAPRRVSAAGPSGRRLSRHSLRAVFG